MGSLKRFVETLPHVEVTHGDEGSNVPVWAHTTTLDAYIARMLGVTDDRKKKQQEEQQQLYRVATEERDDDNSKTNDSHVYGSRVVQPSTTVGDHVITPQHVSIDAGSDSSSVSTIRSPVPAFAPPIATAPDSATASTSGTTSGPHPPATSPQMPHQTAVYTLSQTDTGDSGSLIGIPVIGSIGGSDGGHGDGGGGLLTSTPPLEVLQGGGRENEVMEDRGTGYGESSRVPVDLAQGTVRNREKFAEENIGWEGPDMCWVCWDRPVCVVVVR